MSKVSVISAGQVGDGPGPRQRCRPGTRMYDHRTNKLRAGAVSSCYMFRPRATEVVFRSCQGVALVGWRWGWKRGTRGRPSVTVPVV